MVRRVFAGIDVVTVLGVVVLGVVLVWCVVGDVLDVLGFVWCSRCFKMRTTIQLIWTNICRQTIPNLWTSGRGASWHEPRNL